MHVLHVIDDAGRGLGEARGHAALRAQSDVAMAMCARTVERTAWHDHSVCVLGPGVSGIRAREMGLGAIDRIAPPMREPRFSIGSLRRLVKGRAPVDVVHCWGGRAVELSARALPPDVARCGTLLGFDSRRALAADMSWWEVRTLVFDGTSADLVRERGGHPVRAEAPAGLMVAGERGCRSCGPQLRVGLLGDPVSGADARCFSHTLALAAHVAHPDVAEIVGVCPAGAGSLRRAVRTRRYHAGAVPLLLTDASILEFIASVDIAVVCMDGESRFRGGMTVAASMAMSCGVPVIAWREHVDCRGWPDEIAAWSMVKGPAPTELARPLQDFIGHAETRERVYGALAEMRAPDERWIVQLDEMWQQAIGVNTRTRVGHG